MKKFLSALTFVLLFIVQTSMGEELKILNIAPNFVLAFVIIYSVRSEVLTSAAIGCICGLLLDISGPGINGYNALVLMYISVLVSTISGRFYYENSLVPVIAVFIFGFIFEFIKLLISNALFESLPLFYVTWRYILPECLFNSVVSIPLIYWINWLKNEYIRGI